MSCGFACSAGGVLSALSPTTCTRIKCLADCTQSSGSQHLRDYIKWSKISNSSSKLDLTKKLRPYVYTTLKFCEDRNRRPSASETDLTRVRRLV